MNALKDVTCERRTEATTARRSIGQAAPSISSEMHLSLAQKGLVFSAFGFTYAKGCHRVSVTPPNESKRPAPGTHFLRTSSSTGRASELTSGS